MLLLTPLLALRHLFCRQQRASQLVCRGYDLRGKPQVELSLEAAVVGVLLLTPLLLLLPTLAVFYALLAGLHLAAGMPRPQCCPTSGDRPAGKS